MILFPQVTTQQTFGNQRLAVVYMHRGGGGGGGGVMVRIMFVECVLLVRYCYGN